MSDSSFSGTEDIQEGEGPKVVQSSFKEHSLMSISGLKQEAPAIKIEQTDTKKTQKKPETLEEKNKIKDSENLKNSETASSKIMTKKNKFISKAIGELCFDTPKINIIPIVNKDTTNPDTFNLNYLLSPDVQKIAKSKHRLTQSTTFSSSSSFTFSKNHTKNIKFESIKEISNKKNLISKNLDVEERFYNKAKKTQEKIKAHKDLKETQEIKDCTFKPQIKSDRKKKTYEEFYQYMNKFSQQKETKIKNLKEQEMIAYEKSNDFNYRPELCEKSIKILARKGHAEEPVHERLNSYKNKKPLIKIAKKNSLDDNKKEISKEFHPTLNKKSLMIQRSEPIEKILYDDAIRRKNKADQVANILNTNYTTPNSLKVLVSKLKRDFEEAFSFIDVDSDGKLNYSRTIELLKLLHMVKEEDKREEERLLLLDAWKMLVGEDDLYCIKDSMLIFVLAVMGFHEDWMENSENTKISLTLNESKKLHVKYEIFYKNRIKFIKQYSSCRSIKENNEYSFRPNTSFVEDSTLDNIRAKKRSGTVFEDHLIAEKNRKLQKISEKKAQAEEDIMKECSFRPVIQEMPKQFKSYPRDGKEDLSSEYFKLLNNPSFENTHKTIFLHDLSKTYKEKKEIIVKNQKQKEIIKELEICTFSPQLEKRIFPSDGPQTQKASEKPQIKKPTKRIIQKSAVPKVKASPPKVIIEKKPVEKASAKFFNIISRTDDIAKIGVKVGDSLEILEFNIENDDPTNIVIKFSSMHELKKNEEYKLVKQLTLLKYTND